MSETNAKLRQRTENRTVSAALSDAGTLVAESGSADQSPEEAVEYVLADCSFAVGQAIGMRITVDYDAIVWWHDHFRQKFLAAICRHGPRWLQDRENVTAVGWMLGERAVRHAAGQTSIGVDAARRAAADVERHCQLHSKRAAQRGERGAEANPRLAGYWCVRFPY